MGQSTRAERSIRPERLQWVERAGSPSHH